mgnify:CR=1 FL=1
MKSVSKIFILVLIGSVLWSCQDNSRPNYQFFPNMYEPVGYEAYGEYKVFPNSQEALLPVERTIARGYSLYDYEKEMMPEFYVTIDTPKDPRIHELMSSFTRFRESIDYEFTDELWKDFLLAIGDFGIARIVSGNHLTDFVNALQDHIDTVSVQYDIERSLFKMRQKSIKKIYKFIFENTSSN